MKKTLLTLAVTAATVLGAPAQAASFSSASSAQGQTSHFQAEDVVAFAKKVEVTLANSGARVAVLARMGRPESEMPPGMKYTHVAFAVYSMIKLADGRVVPGYAIHNLYQVDGSPDKSQLVVDYPVDFFAAAAKLEAGILVPTPELQNRLLQIIGTPNYQRIHDPRYSVIANPYNEGRQNCTEFTLDVINAAFYQTSDLKQLKQIAKQHFIAQPVEVNPFKLMLGSVFSAEVSTVDHTEKPVTATFERIADYVLKHDAGARLINVTP